MTGFLFGRVRNLVVKNRMAHFTDALLINLEQPLKIVQCGLALHGGRSEETFLLRGLWAMHAYRYRGALELHGRVFPFRKGFVSLVPPDVPVLWKFPSHAPHYYAHFAAAEPGKKSDSLPVMSELGEAFDLFCERFEGMIACWQTDPFRAGVKLWDMALDLARDRPRDSKMGNELHPNLQIALSIIRNGLHENLKVAGLAKQMGVSQGHLNALFKKTFLTTVHEFIHRHRIERALHLLRHSSLSIKSIAIDTGFPDLQHFNKVVRAAAGQSPRGLRTSKGTSMHS